MLKQQDLTPKLVVDVTVIAQHQVLLVRYEDLKKYDGQPGWFLPDDYLEYGEHPSKAAERILREQVGLIAGKTALVFIESFGFEAGGKWHLVFHYISQLDDIPSVKQMSNIKEARWFALDVMPETATVAHDGWALYTIRDIMELSKIK